MHSNNLKGRYESFSETKFAKTFVRGFIRPGDRNLASVYIQISDAINLLAFRLLTRRRRGRGRGRRRYCVPLECLSRGELEGPGPRRNKDLLSHTQPSPWGHGSLTRANREIRDRAENHGPFESCARSIALSFLSLVPIPPLLPHFYFSRGRFEWRSESERKCAEPKGNKEERRERERETRNFTNLLRKTRYRFPVLDLSFSK